MRELTKNEKQQEVIDTLYELSNVGVGMASVALSKLLGTGISIGIPKVVNINTHISDIVRDDPEKVAVGILMSLENDMSGAVLFIIDNDFLSDLIGKMTGHRLEGNQLIEDEESLSAISEVANIMAASYMKAIGTYTGIRIFLSPVMVGFDMIGALISYPIAQLGMGDTVSFCVDTGFSVRGTEKEKTAGRIIMFPNEDSVTRIMNALNHE